MIARQWLLWQYQKELKKLWAIADAVRGENLRFFPELRHRVAKMLRVLAYDSAGAALPELLRPGKEGCVPWLVAELGNTSTHWCTRAELAAVLGSLARIPALSAAMARSRRSVAGKDIMLDPRAGIRKAGAMQPLMSLLKEVVEVRTAAVHVGDLAALLDFLLDMSGYLCILQVMMPQLPCHSFQCLGGCELPAKLIIGEPSRATEFILHGQPNKEVDFTLG